VDEVAREDAEAEGVALAVVMNLAIASIAESKRR
jgi:hypothetical protein